MKYIEVIFQKENTSFSSVVIKGKKYREVPSFFMKKKWGKKFFFPSFEEAEKWLALWEKKKARAYGLYLLSRKNYCSKELKKKMEMKKINKQIVDDLISEFIKIGYINDEDWIDGYIKKEWKKNISPRMILWKLKQLNNDENFCEERIIFLIPEKEQRKKIKELLNKKGEKGILYLKRKGFDLNLILSVAANLFKIRHVRDNEEKE